MIPLKYNVRSLTVRWVTTLLTVLAIAIVVFASILTFGMIEGIENALTSSGDPEDLIVMRKGADSELSSNVAATMARDLVNLEGVSRNSEGEPLASREFITIMTSERRSSGTANVIVRGLDKIGRELRPDFTIVEGRDLESGVNELISSTRMASRFKNYGLGETAEINDTKFKVVGLFTAGGSAAESEVWADLRDLTGAQRIEGAVSVVNMRISDEDKRVKIVDQIENSDQFKLEAKTEATYFDAQKSSATPLRIIAYIIAGFLTVGAMFAAANTMYSAIASRAREIGTLRALGFSRSSVMTSFVLESILICMLGGILGCLATIPLNGITGGTSGSTFSEITFSFSFGPKVLLRGILLALAMGLIGGLFPALSAIRMQIVNALRQR